MIDSEDKLIEQLKDNKKDINSILDIEIKYNKAQSLKNKDTYILKECFETAIKRCEKCKEIINTIKDGGYLAYKMIILNSKLDAKGLPQDFFRENIYIHKNMLKTLPSPANHTLIRLNNIALVEEIYKAVQDKFMKKYIEENKYDKNNDIVNNYMKINKIKPFSEKHKER